MAYIKEYWTDKEKRAEQARKHTREMQNVYEQQIKESVENTIIYDTDFICKKTRSCETSIIIEELDSVSSIIKHADDRKDRIAVLNFSSYKNPGVCLLMVVKHRKNVCVMSHSYTMSYHNLSWNFTIGIIDIRIRLYI